jgi:hypothetical protein
VTTIKDNWAEPRTIAGCGHVMDAWCQQVQYLKPPRHTQSTEPDRE